MSVLKYAQPGVVYEVFEVEGDIDWALNWCDRNFGSSGNRWFYYNNKFYFRSKKDSLLFDLICSAKR